MTPLPWNIALDERWEIYAKDKTLFYLWPKLSGCDVVSCFRMAIASLNDKSAYLGPHFRLAKVASFYNVCLDGETVAEFAHVGGDPKDLQAVRDLLEGLH